MTRDEHDAKCWRLLKAAIVNAREKMTKEEKEFGDGFLGLMVRCEAEVDSQEGKAE